MKVLVGYATAHGSTREIAERIGARLRDSGLSVDVRSLDSVTDAVTYEAFVLGSAVHEEHWLRPAKDFMRHNAELLDFRPVWIFSVVMPAEMRGPWQRGGRAEEPVIADDVPGGVPYQEHRLLPGVIARDQLRFTKRVLFRLMGCRYGDFRDWDAIDAWAAEISREMSLLADEGR